METIATESQITELVAYINSIKQDCEGKNYVFRIFASRFYQNNRSVGGICGTGLEFAPGGKKEASPRGFSGGSDAIGSERPISSTNRPPASMLPSLLVVRRSRSCSSATH